MTEKPPLWADLLLTLWVLVVALIFFGPSVVPVIGLWTDTGAGFYTLMVLVSAVVLAVKYLRRNDASQKPVKPKERRAKMGKRL